VYWLDLTLDSPAANLALDEALLEEIQRQDIPQEVLRVWEPRDTMVVVGRSSQVATEVRLDECARRGIPIFRRSSGGAAIVTGPGCLMYSVVLSYELRPELRSLEWAHQFVLETLADALAQLVPGVQRAGTSDLATCDLKKFSGNSMRCRRTHLLYHGTILYQFPLNRIGSCLGTPPRQPEYRQGRDHAGFVTNLPVGVDPLRETIRQAWGPSRVLDDWPRAATQRLVAEKYSQNTWNLGR